MRPISTPWPGTKPRPLRRKLPSAAGRDANNGAAADAVAVTSKDHSSLCVSLLPAAAAPERKRTVTEKRCARLAGYVL